MNKSWGALLLVPLAACSSGEDKAVQACETVLATFEASASAERRAKIEKRQLEGDRVRLLIQTTNGLGETIFKDLDCIFKLDRQLTEREATVKLTEIIEDKSRPFSVSLIDSDLRRKGQRTIAETLKERGLDAIRPSETRLKLND